MNHDEAMKLFWQVLPYLLPVVSYLIGKALNTTKVPAKIKALLGNADVQKTLKAGIAAASAMKQMTDEQKREYVRAWAKSELYGVLGEWLPDSSVNYLIENAIVKSK